MADPETNENVNQENEEIIREAEAFAAKNEEYLQEECVDGPSEIEVLKAALTAANDRYLRLMAEFDNYRRRTAREQLEFIEVANAKLLEKLSEVLDNFERASLPENRGCDINGFAKGMDMIHDQFEKVLTEAGLQQINPVGEPFDPSCQEALLKQPSEEVEENHVIQVFQKGYRLKNKIIKTAKVIVSAGK